MSLIHSPSYMFFDQLCDLDPQLRELLTKQSIGCAQNLKGILGILRERGEVLNKTACGAV